MYVLITRRGRPRKSVPMIRAPAAVDPSLVDCCFPCIGIRNPGVDRPSRFAVGIRASASISTASLVVDQPGDLDHGGCRADRLEELAVDGEAGLAPLSDIR